MKRSILRAAKVIRSKNSGPYELTLDILFKDREHFELFRRRNIVTKRKIAALYRRPVGDILKMISTDPGSVSDVAAWTAKTGQELLGHEDVEGKHVFYIKKTK